MQPVFVNNPRYPEVYAFPNPYLQNQEPPKAYPHQSQQYYQPYRENPQPQYTNYYPEDDIPDSNYENEVTTDNNPPAESHIITPRISQDSVFNKNKYSYSTSTYCFDKIFLTYLITSIIYIPMNIAINYIYLSENILGWAGLILIILGIIIFQSIKKYTKSYNSEYTITILIGLIIFKTLFFLVLSYAEYYSNSQVDSQTYDNVSDIEYKFLQIPHFLFESAGTVLFYLFLIIYSKIQPEINLGVVGLLGVIASAATYAPLYFYFEQMLANIVAGLIMIEVGALIFSIYMSRKKELLLNNETVNNIIIIDYYKFFLIACAFLVMILVYIFMLYCFCLCLSGMCQRRPTSYDSHGNIYDQYGDYMGIHLSRRPHSYANGKFYDSFGREIEQSACQIF